MKCSGVKARRNEGAIRPLDVAAVVCVLAVLAWVGLLGGRRWQEHALRTQCQGSFRQLGAALQLYTQDYRGWLPDCSPANPRFMGSLWPWDLHTNLVDALVSRGASRPVFYCPANPAMNDDRHWNFWRANPSPIRVAGYGMLFKGIGQVPPNLWRAKLAGDGQTPPSQTELSFDATAGIDGDYLNIKGIWVDRSNHVRDGQPTGGNVLLEDEHADWRDFKDMQVRFSTIGPGGWVQWSY